ncbi:hypothetical protein SCP_0406540 [Sparassis crispa]|uniref:Uncharacterized protein n=1 Tax=Sparassis crispa TaxID=139825 RepID=A0A401GJD8_9APHY|nr:hypothetical protein SCP_0406540 [Sparassis crispa]GBE82270.1 hypothetical protein SCP_0406540 [Sparassis crispa]
MDQNLPKTRPCPPSPLARKRAHLSKPDESAELPSDVRQPSVALLALALVSRSPHLSSMQMPAKFATIPAVKSPVGARMVPNQSMQIALAAVSVASTPTGRSALPEMSMQASLNNLEAALHQVRMDIVQRGQSD